MLNAVGQAQHIAIFGGTSDIGVAIARAFLSRGPARVTLAARESSPRLADAVSALETAGATDVQVVDFDATAFGTHPEVVECVFANQDVDVAVVAFGSLGDQEELWQDQAKAVASAQLNYTAAVSVGVLLGQRFRAQGHGTIVALSSVAGMRVRRSNFVYGASKAGLDGFYLNLGEALRGSGARVLVVRPGQVRTAMTSDVPEAPLTVNPEDVAEATVAAVLDKKDTLFVHPLFRYVSTALQCIPRTVLRHLPI